MRKYRNWILGLGIMAAPGLAVAETFPFAQAPVAAPAPTSGAPRAINNQDIAEGVARALRSAKLPGSNIDITFTGGVAKLTGQIGDPRAKAVATQVVSSVPGVMRVDNQLQVTAAPKPAIQQAGFDQPFGPATSPIQQVAHTQPAPVPVPMTNQETAERIGAALSSAQLSGYKIKIGFNKGNAILAGSVATPQQKAQAEQVAKSVPGVVAVNNQLQVMGAAPSAIQQTAFQPPMTDAAPMAPMGPPIGAPVGAPPMAAGFPGAMPPGGGYGNAVPGANPTIYNQPYLPNYAWPAQAQYPNSAAIQYPKQYSASAWPYIGPFYPYPQVPLGWRKATLEWDDGQWMLDFDSKTDRWFWFMNPKNW